MVALATFGLALAVSVTATPGVRRLALSCGAVDRPGDPRRVHTTATPRLGGIGIVVATCLACVVASLFPVTRAAFRGELDRLAALAVAGVAIAALGVFDDIRGANARTKLTVQFAAALVLYAAGFRVDRIDGLFGTPLELGLLSLPITSLWIVGVSNAVNLVDGLDGLAGGLALAATVALFALGARGGDTVVMVVAAGLAGGIAGFLVYNVNPASVFMGDTGSLFLGAMLGALSVRLLCTQPSTIPTVAVVVVLGLPLMDTAGAIVRRAIRGAPLFSADREHLHHRLIAAGLSHRHAVVALWGGAALCALAGVQVTTGAMGRTTSIASSVVALGLGVAWLGLPTSPTALLMRRRRNRERLAAVRAAGRRLRDLTTLVEINESLARLARTLDVRAIRVHTTTGVGHGGAVQIDGSEDRLRTDFRVPAGTSERATMEVLWVAPQGDRDVHAAVERLCGYVAAALRRIDRHARRSAFRRIHHEYTFLH